VRDIKQITSKPKISVPQGLNTEINSLETETVQIIIHFYDDDDDDDDDDGTTIFIASNSCCWSTRLFNGAYVASVG